MAASDVEFRCFVGGLAWATNNRALEQAFSPFGEIIESKVVNNKETGRSRSFCFVTFATEQSMRDAIEGMNGQSLDERNISVNEAQSQGSGGGGGYRGGGRGYGGGGGGGYRDRGRGGYGGGRSGGYGGSRGRYGSGGYSRGGGGSSGDSWRHLFGWDPRVRVPASSMISCAF